MMKCFSRFSAKERKRAMRKEILPLALPKLEYRYLTYTGEPYQLKLSKAERTLVAENAELNLRLFKFRELAAATDNFRPENLLGVGGFGRVYKGTIDTGQIVAVKQLDMNGSQGNKEFVVEVLTLRLLRHPNLVQLVGYCVHGNQRLLVYEYMPLGSLNTHLFGIAPDKAPLSWYQRMKIAFGSALGLEYLHENWTAQVIYRDLKCTNILLDEYYNPKLSDFGLAKAAPWGGNTAVLSQVMGTFGYLAPEYVHVGELSVKSDVYSFGVVMLELITGRQAVDNTRPSEEQNLVTWARHWCRDQKRIKYLVDPLLKGHYPQKGLNQAVAVAMMCLQDVPPSRPLMSDVAVALMQLAIPPEGEASISSHLAESSQQSDVAMALMQPAIPPEGEASTSSHPAESSQQEKPPVPQKYRTLAEALQWALETVAEEEEDNKAQNSGVNL